MQSSTRSLLNTSDHLAEHIAQQSAFMGLDDAEEQLLWRYFAMRGQKETPREVIDCLAQQGQLQAYDMVDVQLVARMPAQWIKPSGWFKRAKDLTQVSRFLIENDMVLFTTNLDAAMAKRIHQAQYHAFEYFYPHLRPVTQGGTKRWPSSSDIQVTCLGEPRDLTALIRNMVGA